MCKRIVVSSRLTNDTFGCNFDYFQKFIAGKSLVVIEENDLLVIVLDELGDQWTVFKGDFFEFNQLSIFD